jgi:DNA polymerase I-like protein with 3'-5' exonuclease and polymerase domains
VEHRWKIVRTERDLQELVEELSRATEIACDTETYGKIWDKDKRLLGVSFSWIAENYWRSCYVPLCEFSGGRFEPLPIDVTTLGKMSVAFIGHNAVYDMRWLEGVLSVRTGWRADTRIMWHLADPDQRQYGLKVVQTKMLGWPERGDNRLRKQVENRGGSLDKGDHYLADLEILAEYACLDTKATLELYLMLKPWFDRHSYWPLLRDIMAYDELLMTNTAQGIAVDREGLERASKRITEAKEKARRKLLKSLGPQIRELEADWVDTYIAGMTRKSAIELYKKEVHRHEKFNFNSDPHKRSLFYHKLGFEQLYFTKPSKKAKTKRARELSTSLEDLKLSSRGHSSIKHYEEYEKNNTLSSSFALPYLESIGSDGRLHPGFNITGTVSYRLSGFKPYLLNAPFEEKAIMRPMRVDEGHIGVHADLAAIEPTITAHYSEDPSLLKVFRDGLGDIYLDLALSLFPNDKELQDGYNPNIPITAEVKKRFERQRKIAKIIQLAVQYTGTGHTVSKNLSKAGEPTTIEQADYYVVAYWKKFEAVALFNRRLHALYAKKGFVKNIIGRIIHVPSPEYKDLPNRLIQSSGHDVLVRWVLAIYEHCLIRNIDIKPVLLDCHDSTSNQCPIEQSKDLVAIYQETLQQVQSQIGLSVKLKCEIKTFKTLAGLKTDE